MKRILFESSSYDEFMAELCSKINDMVSDLKNDKSPVIDELLTRQEAAEMLKITLPTLHSWTKNRILTPNYMGRRVYYKKQDILFLFR